MCDIINRFSINCHSSIRCDNGNMVLRFDPFRVEDTPHDAGLVFITHDHYDHFSPEDIRRVLSPDGFIVLPDTCYRTVLEAGFEESALLPVHTGVTYELLGLSFRAVATYNEGKISTPRPTAGWAMWSQRRMACASTWRATPITSARPVPSGETRRSCRRAAPTP